jgi:hypothetical protein
MLHALRFLNAVALAVALSLANLSPAFALDDTAHSPANAPADPSPAIEPVHEASGDTESLLWFYMATGAWIAILTAATLAILIMAHRIAVAQRIRPLSEHRHRARNSL